MGRFVHVYREVSSDSDRSGKKIQGERDLTNNERE